MSSGSMHPVNHNAARTLPSRRYKNDSCPVELSQSSLMLLRAYTRLASGSGSPCRRDSPSRRVARRTPALGCLLRSPSMFRVSVYDHPRYLLTQTRTCTGTRSCGERQCHAAAAACIHTHRKPSTATIVQSQPRPCCRIRKSSTYWVDGSASGGLGPMPGSCDTEVYLCPITRGACDMAPTSSMHARVRTLS